MSKVAIGWTESDRAAGYISYMDGWKPEAEQEVWVIDIPDYFATDIERVAEAVFEATNAPYELPVGSLGIWFQNYFKTQGGVLPRSLSVGDTVSFVHYDAEANMVPAAVVSCESMGWKRRF